MRLYQAAIFVLLGDIFKACTMFGSKKLSGATLTIAMKCLIKELYVCLSSTLLLVVFMGKKVNRISLRAFKALVL